MSRQIDEHENDRNYQRILWRFDTNIRINHYKLKTVNYATACAPFLAIHTLQQLAMHEQCNYSEVCERILKDFYVDVVLTGASDHFTPKHRVCH